MAEKSPIEFDMVMSATTGPPTALNSPSPPTKTVIFHMFFIIFMS